MTVAILHGKHYSKSSQLFCEPKLKNFLELFVKVERCLAARHGGCDVFFQQVLASPSESWNTLDGLNPSMNSVQCMLSQDVCLCVEASRHHIPWFSIVKQLSTL